MTRFHRYAIVLLGLASGCTSTWAEGTWRLSEETIAAARERLAARKGADDHREALDGLRLEVYAATARIVIDGSSVDPFEYAVDAVGWREVELTRTTEPRSMPMTLTLSCSSGAVGECTAVDVTSAEQLGIIPAPLIVFTRVP